jgi:hypothetical protein
MGKRNGGSGENYDKKYDRAPGGFEGAGRLVIKIKMAVNRRSGKPDHANALAAYDAFKRQLGA